jgi:hypothetical protein
MNKSKMRYVGMSVVAGVLTLLTVLSHRYNLQAQSCGPGQVWACVSVFDPNTGTYREQCSCCEAGGAGTPVSGIVTPQPTATPFPPYSETMCLSDECPAGETRYSLVSYDCSSGVQPGVNVCWPTDVVYLEDCCGPHCPCGEPTSELQPCTGSATGLNCSEFEASVKASLPVWTANREPYPRALVTLPEEVWVSDAAGNPVASLPTVETWGDPVNPGGSNCDCRANGTCDEDPPPKGTVCDYKLGLRVEPGNEPPTWSFEGCGSMTGWRARCGWNRSSWGKPELGVGMAPDCPTLPAYTVHATVPYWWSFARQWYTWEKVGDDCECVCHGGGGTNECSGEEGLCVNAPDTEHWELECDPVYGWKHHAPDWVLLDLRDYGWPTPYMINPNVQLIPHPPCEPNPPVGAIYVPCIEVQAPIEKQQ